MHRLVVELSTSDLGVVSPLQMVRAFEILHILRLEPKEFAALVRVVFESQPFAIEELFPNSQDAEVEHDLLEQGKDGSYTYFIKIKSKAGRQRPLRLSPLTAGGYLSVPFEVKEGRLKVTFLGTTKQVKGVIESLQKARMRHKVVSLTDAKVSPLSPLGQLTERQREVLTVAYRLGYYERPRRISSEQLAEKLKLSSSTFIAHRRKAEQRLLAQLVGEA